MWKIWLKMQVEILINIFNFYKKNVWWKFYIYKVIKNKQMFLLTLIVYISRWNFNIAYFFSVVDELIYVLIINNSNFQCSFMEHCCDKFSDFRIRNHDLKFNRTTIAWKTYSKLSNKKKFACNVIIILWIDC